MSDARLILFHKQSTSARIRFLKFGHGGVCGFDPIPMPAAVLEDGETPPGGGNTVVRHPAALAADAERRLGLEPGDLEPDATFLRNVDVPGGPIQIHLAHFTTVDPPFERMTAAGASFIEFTEARGLGPVDLLLLRQVYEYAIG